jgi:uncharacterized protein (TIGR03083 family)
MDFVEVHREGRERVLELAADLDDDAASTVVRACPQWTVKDVYAHMAGVPADILAGRLEGVATDPWTARQVAERADRSLQEICAELVELGPGMDEVLTAFGDAMDPRLFIDQWSHEQDVRGTLQRPGGRDVPIVGWIAGALIGLMGDGWASKGRPTVRIVGTSGEWLLGEGEPELTLTTTDFELARGLVGRRSRDELLRMGWDGDASAVVDHLHVLPFAAADLDE